MASEEHEAESVAAEIQQLLENRQFDEATRLVEPLADQFTNQPVLQHLAGLVWERTYLEKMALGQAPTLDHYENAERHYRLALEHDAEHADVHGPRLYAVLFVLGTQQADEEKLQEALDLARVLSNTSDKVLAESYAREMAIVLSAIARATQNANDWTKAEDALEAAPKPNGGREAFFFYFYLGLVKRERGSREEDENSLRDAANAFRRALAENTNRGLEFMFADCLVQLSDPSPSELSEIDELIEGLLDQNPDDKLVKSLDQRRKMRQRLLED